MPLPSTRIDRAPLFEALDPAEQVLIAGAGGGFDVFCGLPLYFALEEQGKRVHLANLSFSNLAEASGTRLSPTLLEVTADSTGPTDYFPEKHLCTWFRAEGHEVSVYAFKKSGVVPLREAYARLVDHLRIDTVLLVDGGTDSLMKGDEAGLGTPAEDMASLAAVHSLDLPRKFLACLGFGVDAFHGVSHFDVLEAVAELTRLGASLGSFALLPGMPPVRRYVDAIEYVHRIAPARPSIVNASVVSAIEGQYGDHHRTERTRGSELWINPLMAQYFAFGLSAVAERVLYLDQIAHTRSAFEVEAIIEAFRHTCDIRPRRTIPV